MPLNPHLWRLFTNSHGKLKKEKADSFIFLGLWKGGLTLDLFCLFSFGKLSELQTAAVKPQCPFRKHKKKLTPCTIKHHPDSQQTWCGFTGRVAREMIATNTRQVYHTVQGQPHWSISHRASQTAKQSHNMLWTRYTTGSTV